MALDELPPLTNLTGCGKTLFSRRSTQINADKTFVLNPRLSAFIRGQPFDGIFQHPAKGAVNLTLQDYVHARAPL